MKKTDIHKQIVSFLDRKIYRSIMPKEQLYECYREKLQLKYELPNDVSLKIASTKDELEQAYELIYREYKDINIVDLSSSRMKISQFNILPTTTTLIVKKGEKVIGTLTLVQESEIGLPIEECFNIDYLKNKGKNLAEVTGLAVDKDFRGDGHWVTMSLVHYLFNYCMKYIFVDTLVIAVHPKAQTFYEAFMGFESHPDEKVIKYKGAKDALAVSMHLNLKPNDYRFKLQLMYGDNKKENNFCDFIFNYEMKNALYPKRKFYKFFDPVLTPPLIKFFFKEKSDILGTANEKIKKSIKNYYIQDEYEKVMPGLFNDDQNKRGESSRFQSHLSCSLFNQFDICPAKIKNFSISGCKLYINKDIKIGSEVQLKINLGLQDKTYLRFKCVWSDKNNCYGLEIINSCKEWREFVNCSENEILGLSLVQDFEVAV